MELTQHVGLPNFIGSPYGNFSPRRVSMARDVQVTWVTQDQTIVGGGADHFVVLLGTTEVNEPLTSRTHLFPAVAPGTYQGAVSVCKADGTELKPPVIYSITVVDVAPPAMTPVPVSVTAVLK
jgi:hypothetical protein